MQDPSLTMGNGKAVRSPNFPVWWGTRLRDWGSSIHFPPHNSLFAEACLSIPQASFCWHFHTLEAWDYLLVFFIYLYLVVKRFLVTLTGPHESDIT